MGYTGGRSMLRNYIQPKRKMRSQIATRRMARSLPAQEKKKGQAEVRCTVYADAVDKLGHRIAAEITRKDFIDLVNCMTARGANVQAGNLLQAFTLTYEFAIKLVR